MTWLLNLTSFFKGLTLEKVWGFVKTLVAAIAVAFMLYQAYSMSSLRQDVALLEGKQQELQTQVLQIESNYDYLNGVYKHSTQIQKEFLQKLAQNSEQAVGLEKSFAELERNTAKKAQEALLKKNLQPTDTTPKGEGNDANSSDLGGSEGDTDSSNPDNDIGWRKLLDSTYCTAFPKEPKCSNNS